MTEPEIRLTGPSAEVLARRQRESALRVAARDNRAEEVRKLLSEGADPNARDGDGWTPLHLAAWAHADDAIEALIAGGARICRRDNNGRTPMHVAEYLGTALLLRKHGADINERDNAGQTLLHHWARCGECGNYVGNHTRIKGLIEAGAEINVQDKKGATPLHCLTVEGTDLESCKVLLDLGADATIRDNRGRTAKDIARGHHFREMAALLGAAARKDRGR